MSGSFWEALPKVQETLLDEPEWWEDLPNVREWLGGFPGCPEVVGSPSRKSRRPSRMNLSGGRTFQMSGSGREHHPDIREW